MSIYFQFPAIDEYPNLAYPLKTELHDTQQIKVEDNIAQEQLSELKDFLSLKPV
ncbi:hypothetical protein G7074_24325 [Pedobacter sp. HDW13]|uniref:hypothetical protein n=1 Tax=unclassified Pedobacter TaxID=2628915 RepID=UPI00131A1C44|nr:MULTISPECIES: hypothetical protein [unclassified Pedobacter]QIL42117.1 hypothetical protein G7074_24325 [Pedobacter sp. HDW13]